MNAWIPKKLNYQTDTVTDTSKDYQFTVTAKGAQRFLVVVNASAVTGPVSVVVKTAIGGLPTNVTHSTTPISSTGQTIIEVLSTTPLPILSQGTVTVISPTTKSITITSIHILQEE
jgi:hypothetical protein